MTNFVSRENSGSQNLSLRLPLLLAVFLVTLGIGSRSGAQPGTLDSSFTSATADDVYDIQVASDGHFFVRYYTGVGSFNQDGTPDTTFNPGIPVGTVISSIVLQSDGKLLVSGGFLQLQGVKLPCLARFNSDSTLDTNFVPPFLATTPVVNTNPFYPPPSPPTNTIGSIVVQPDGKILLSQFKNLVAADGSALPRLVRLNADGTLDTGFAVITNQVDFLAVQSDGKLLIAQNYFDVYHDWNSALSRLNSDGSPDSSFVSCNIYGRVNTICPLSNGKAMIGGNFSRINGLGYSLVARINSDGSLDTGFRANIFGVTQSAFSILPQPDGRLLIAGQFSISAFPAFTNIARLNPDGSVDPFYGPAAANNYIMALAFQPDGKLLVGGEYTQFSHQPIWRLVRLNSDAIVGPGQFAFDAPIYNVYENAGAVTLTVKRLSGSQGTVTVNYSTADGTATSPARYQAQNGTLIFQDGETAKNLTIPVVDDTVIQDLQSFQVALGATTGGATLNGQSSATVKLLDDDGPSALDPSFTLPPGTLDGTVRSILVQPDGKILIGGEFQQVGNYSRRGIARLNADGTVDPTFDPGTGLGNGASPGWTKVLQLQPDGKVLVAGVFTSVDGIPQNYFSRLNTNGSLDLTFNIGTGANDSKVYVGVITAMNVLSNSQILVGGGFGTFNSVGRSGLARLTQVGSVDPLYNPTVGPSGLVPYSLQLDEKVVVVVGSSSQIARLNSDGSIENGAFATAANVSELESLTNGNTLVAGNFSTVSGQPRQCIARLRSTGAVDPNFVPNLSLFSGTYPPFIYNFIAQPDGKVIISVQSYRSPAGRFVARLNDDGSLDTDFEPVMITLPGDDQPLVTFALQADGRILVGGQFKTVNGLSLPYLVRLRGGGRSGSRQLLVNSVNPPANQISVSVAPGKPFALQVSTNCIDWLSLVTNTVPTSAFTYVDSQVAGSSHRFYRVKQLVP